MKIRSKAPLRLGFAGGGSDVSPFCDQYGGHVLNACIDMFSFCTIEETSDNKLYFYAADRDESFYSNAVPEIKIDSNLSLHKGVYNRIVKDFLGGKAFPCKITTYSDAPAGSGLGSSSTMVVTILTAFIDLLNLPMGEYDIAALSFQIERNDLLLSGGRQDQYAATFGGFNFMEFYENERVIVNPLRIKDDIVNELESSIVLYYTGVSRESANIIAEQITNATKQNNVAIDAMHQVKKDALTLKEYLLKGQIDLFAKYINNAWEAKKKMANTISNKKLDDLYAYALNNGAIAGKISGAGGGGYMMFLVDPLKRISLLNALSKLDGNVVNFHFYKQGVQSWKP